MLSTDTHTVKAGAVTRIDATTRLFAGLIVATFAIGLIVDRFGGLMGQVGVGVGKAGDVIGAVRKGVADGKKHLVKVPLTRHNSIPTLSNGRDGAASVLIRPAAPGTGVIAGGSIRTVLELAGIKNVPLLREKCNGT